MLEKENQDEGKNSKKSVPSSTVASSKSNKSEENVSTIKNE